MLKGINSKRLAEIVFGQRRAKLRRDGDSCPEPPLFRPPDRAVLAQIPQATEMPTPCTLMTRLLSGAQGTIYENSLTSRSQKDPDWAMESQPSSPPQHPPRRRASRYIDPDLQKKQEKFVDPEFRSYLLDQVPKGELLHSQCRLYTPEWRRVVGPLSRMYLELNRQLGLVCQHLSYPPKQWEWDQSEPLEELAKLFQGIECTEWYQRRLNMMLLPPTEPHPWTQILT